MAATTIDTLPSMTKSVIMWEEKDLPGFFKDYFKMVRNALTNDQFNQFSKLKTNQERVRFVFSIPAAHDIDIKPYFKGKSEKEALEKKEAGNMCFSKKNNVEALKLYSQAVIKAPVPTEECADPKKMTLYAICLANRSAALYHLKDYRHCVKDINEALEHHYPRELKHKLYKRKARLLSHMKQHEDAREAYRQALKWLDWAKMEREKRIEHQNDIQKWLKLYETGKGVKNFEMEPEPVDMQLPAIPEVTGGRHPKYPSLSRKVDVRSDNQQGRYVVAVEDIEPGDTICAEKPFAAVLLRDMFGTHCQNCFKLLKAPIPCKKCSNVVFCSVECRQDAYFHQTECPIQDLLLGSGMSINCFLAIRLLVQKPLSYFLEIKDDIVTEKYKENLEKKEIYDPEDFFRLYNLVCHSERRTSEDYFHRVVMVVFMVKALKKTKYFEDKGTGINYPLLKEEGDTISETEAYVGSLLMHFLEIVQFNSHEVSEFWLSAPKSLSNSKNESLGAAIFPTLALFNHSCITGQVRYFSGSSAITKSIRFIPKGEQVPENYGQSFTSAPRSERRQYLFDRYWFECACEACVKDWPKYQDMSNTVLNFKCRKCTSPLPVDTENTLNPILKCEKCGEQTNIMAALKNLQNSEQTFLSASKEMDNFNLEKAESLLLENLKQLESSLYPPYKDYHQTQEAYMRVMLTKGGNYRVKTPKSEE
ncbi:SET and MYND domain-containing protein 4-like isoform X2 [Palaemon carinicauda]|uniref:SET and MYND domain-containing protein 4-like isoform X2 n=1 Tax=Palaemon carinicauda TaxID=392227 RepID=UPI0035B5918B